MRNRNPQLSSEHKHNAKYVGRRPIMPPKTGPTMQPMIAPIDDTNCVIALASGTLPPVILSAHSGAHCTEPQVPIRATDANEMARIVVFNRPDEKISLIGREAVPVTDSFQRSDSGTNNRIKN